MDSHIPLLTDTRQILRQCEARIDRRFEQLDRRFEQIDHRFAQLDARIDRLDRKIDAQGLKRIDTQGHSLTRETTMELWCLAGIMLTGFIAVVAALLSQQP